MDLLLVPFSLIIISLYLGLILFGNHLAVWLLCLFVACLLYLIYSRKTRAKDQKDLQNILHSKTNLLLLFIIFLTIAVTSFAVSPFIVTRTADRFEHIQITPVGDYYKHTYMVNAIAQDGIPPSNPYFPKSKLSYYYGFYLIPALITRLSHFPGYLVTFWFVLFSNFLVLCIAGFLTAKFIKKPLYRLLVLSLIVTGMGADSIPFVFGTHGQLQNDQGVQIINIYKTILFAPQHFFATGIAIWTIYHLLHKKSSAFLLALFSSLTLLSSIFVSITLIFWLFLIFIFKKETRKTLLTAAGLTFVILIPYFLAIKNRNNLFYRFEFDPYPFFSSYYLNVLATFLVKYGPIIFLSPMLLLFRSFRRPLYVIGIFTVFAVTWFIRTPIFNDFGMRTSIPIWLVFPILIFACLEKQKNKLLSGIIIIATLITIAIGAKGFYQETLKVYQGRYFMLPAESELIRKLRTLPSTITLSTPDYGKWAEYVPSLAARKITTPYLYDSYMYFDNQYRQEFGDYEAKMLDTFRRETKAKSLEELIATENEQLAKLPELLSQYPTTLIIFNDKIWVREKDRNPWPILFKEINTPEIELVNGFTAFPFVKLLNALAQNKIVINHSKTIPLKLSDHGFDLTAGVWFISSCATSNYRLRLEPDDYYVLFDQTLEADSCLGQLFYAAASERISYTPQSTISNLYASPVEIEIQ